MIILNIPLLVTWHFTCPISERLASKEGLGVFFLCITMVTHYRETDFSQNKGFFSNISMFMTIEYQ